MDNTLSKLKKWLNIKDSLKLFNRIQRGIYSSEPIQKNKIIIKIKSKFLIEYQQIYKIYPIDGIEEANSLVAFYLTKLFFESDEYWLNYLETFPTDISEYPIFWSQSDFINLKQTSLMTNGFTNLDSHQESIMFDYEIIYNYNKEHQIIENINDNDLYSKYMNFRILVGSRIFGYNKHGEPTSGMVPYIDLINHSINSNTTWYFDDSSDSFLLVSTQDIPKNQEIVDNYGAKSNIDLLLFYGFTLDPNPNPLLRFNIDNINYEFDLNSSLDIFNNNDLKIKIINKLKNILNHHTNKLKNNIIKNIDLINIFNDEIIIITNLLKR